MKKKDFTYWPFDQARRYTINLRLKTRIEWEKWHRTYNYSNAMPPKPHKYYQNDWVNWSYFLGLKRLNKVDRKKILVGFEEAREYARGLNVNTVAQWRTLCRRDDFPEHIAKDPNKTFKDTGWINWLDWLDTENVPSKIISEQFYTYNEARDFVTDLTIASMSKWYAYCKSGERPSYIPSNPSVIYKDCGWTNWRTFLGNNQLNRKEIRSKYYTFKDAQAYICTLGLKSQPDYIHWCKFGKRPEFIPYDVATVYAKEGWQSWGHFLNTNNLSPMQIRNAFIPLEEARVYVKALNIKSIADWLQLCRDGKRPTFIPSNPERSYNDWISWYHFLGKSPNTKYPDNSRAFVDSLHYPNDSNVYLIIDDSTLIVSTVAGDQDESLFTVEEFLRKVNYNEYVELFEMKNK